MIGRNASANSHAEALQHADLTTLALSLFRLNRLPDPEPRQLRALLLAVLEEVAVIDRIVDGGPSPRLIEALATAVSVSSRPAS